MAIRFDFCLTVSPFGLPPLHVRTLPPPKAINPEQTLYSIIPFSSSIVFTDFWLSADGRAFLSPWLKIFHLHFVYIKHLKST